MDMYQVMKALRQVHFSGAVELDHVPQLAGDSGLRRAGTAYRIAYMRALLRRANEEVGRSWRSIYRRSSYRRDGRAEWTVANIVRADWIDVIQFRTSFHQ
jgi:hypothetical protein